MNVSLTGLVGIDQKDRWMKNYHTMSEEVRDIEESRFATFEISFVEGTDVETMMDFDKVLLEEDLDID